MPFTLFLITLGLAWLCIIIAIFLIIYTTGSRFCALIKNNVLRLVSWCTFLFLFFLSIIISVKLLAFDVYKVPSSSMENMLYPGDVIIVNKLKYGPKLPDSPFQIPLVNMAFYMNHGARAKMNEQWWDYIRLQGTAKIKHGDVFVFSLDLSRNFFVVKRCLGLPGDLLNIIDGEIYTNNKLFKSPGCVKDNFQFKIKNRVKFYKLMDSLDIHVGIISGDKSGIYRNATFSKEEYEFLKKTSCVDSIKKNRDSFDIVNQELIQTMDSRWTLDNMGSLRIPKKGMEVVLNPDNFMLYRKIIKLFEKSTIVYKNGNYFINGKKAITYKFKQNYYFMMGDNRKETMDSRFWGFLPEANIVGKLQCVIFSNKKD